MKIAVVGATGLVGRVMVKLLEERKFPLDDLIPVASKNSIGQSIIFKDKPYSIVSIEEALKIKPDIALFSAGGSTSLEWAPKFAENGTKVIDNSSAWRMDSNKKLIVPEINADALEKDDMIIANPNCSTIQMVVAIGPLHNKYNIKRLVISTYQSVSGTGKNAVDQLKKEANKDGAEKVYPHQIYQNLLPHCDVFEEGGYTKEEIKLINETRKILNDDSIKITSTAVRVPIEKCHGESINLEFHNEFEIEDVLEVLNSSPGLKVIDDVNKNLYPMPELLFLQSDPCLSLKKDMDRTVERVIQAIENKEKIMILGDYDVDGTTSVSMLYDYFKKKNLEPLYYIPDRYKEGYGVSAESITFAAEQKVALIITIDCGIKAKDKIQAANDKGIDVIICDHHIPDTSIPKAYSIINPNQKDCDYPFKGLCGCGIGFKLISAIEKKMGGREEVNQYLDLVAIATIADQMPMINENRTIVHHGLKELNKNPRPGFHFFIRSINRDIVESDISFNIGPRINASGRMKSGMISVQLMTEKETNKAYKIAQEIESINLLRRSKEKEVTEEAIKKTDPLKFTNIVYGSDWNKGVLGIAASRLVDKFYKPTIVLTLDHNTYTGSARSVANFDIYEAIDSGKEYLDQYGGHKYAAGVSIKEENLKGFIDHFESYVKSAMDNKMFVKTLGYDIEINLADINEENFKILSRMSPFGNSNYKPIFRTNNCCLAGNLRLMGKEKNHIKFQITDSTDHKIQALGFNMPEHYEQINNKEKFDILYTISRNTFNHSSLLELNIKAISFK